MSTDGARAPATDIQGMMSSSPEDLAKFYRDRQARFSEDLGEAKKKINQTSNLRIALAVVILACLYGGATYTTGLLYVLIPLIGGFVVLVQVHTRLFLRKVHLENLVKINADELESLSGNREALHAGSEFIDPHHPYTHDLDIFGEGSVYQMINRANTLDGRHAMAKLLNEPLPSAARILEQQQAVTELKTEVDLRQDLAASGMEINEQTNDRKQLLDWLSAPYVAYGRPMLSTLLWLLPALTITAWLLYFIGVIPQIIAYLLVFAQWTIWGSYSKRINVFHEYISRKKAILEKYAFMLAVIRNEPTARANEHPTLPLSADDKSRVKEKHAREIPFQSRLLTEIFLQANDAGEKVSKLASLVTRLNARLNVMTAFFVNSLFLYDLRCVYRLEKWKADNGERLPAWLKAISDVEALSSVANFTFNHPHCQFPVIHSEMTILAKDMGHPLLHPSECVTNSVNFGPAPTVLIITGANMAGKSTFLRAIGVNLVLGLAGAPVYASAFECPVIPLRSGMRTADSLKDHESYFYAELNRLKSIIEDLRQGKPLFILLDEILKGTNSNDKQKGSIALVHQLLEYPCLGIVATHDLALGAISTEHPSAVHNYCFEASINDDQLSFDYKLKPGLAQNMNATFLMKKMGIIKNH